MYPKQLSKEKLLLIEEHLKKFENLPEGGVYFLEGEWSTLSSLRTILYEAFSVLGVKPLFKIKFLEGRLGIFRRKDLSKVRGTVSLTSLPPHLENFLGKMVEMEDAEEWLDSTQFALKEEEKETLREAYRRLME